MRDDTLFPGHEFTTLVDLPDSFRKSGKMMAHEVDIFTDDGDLVARLGVAGNISLTVHPGYHLEYYDTMAEATEARSK
ncbi:hypothetical protein [Mycolicibacter kumamotonensis]|uniref:Uncharacterized protein n=1 Tax=Mycolicibacter kumamotonensis TaxID=354243 RepID=A0A1B8SL85_9MYCO|nr:hypothetical protein [Mycolicibacter kumamotonensis]OBY33491.1 hypothetical protein ACT18_00660 [Mycolicibacter kumamotonensis]